MLPHDLPLCALSGPGLVRIESGMPIFPMSCSGAAAEQGLDEVPLHSQGFCDDTADAPNPDHVVPRLVVPVLAAFPSRQITSMREQYNSAVRCWTFCSRTALRLQLILVGLQPQDTAQPGDEILRINRLAEQVGGARSSACRFTWRLSRAVRISTGSSWKRSNPLMRSRSSSPLIPGILMSETTTSTRPP